MLTNDQELLPRGGQVLLPGAGRIALLLPHADVYSILFGLKMPSSLVYSIYTRFFRFVGAVFMILGWILLVLRISI
jgi:hypothetical protein